MAGDIWTVVHDERAALAHDLGALRREQWDADSLCAGWAVRDVVAHLAATAMLSKCRFVGEIVLGGFSPDRIVRRQVAVGRTRGPEQLLAQFAAAVRSTASPPLPVISRIVEIVVHAEDIRRPLGLGHAYRRDHIGAAVAYLAAHRFSGGRRRLAGLSLVGTDAGFTVGDGLTVEGPAVSLLLAASGRRVALGELNGPGVAVLAAR
ncbi:maleylpyruvate isomerase family mycothiol-dependent enzyme [Mycolicibacterium sp. 120266]|uniref:maleylpyruvate isomerase family mycothiol-dependent enzyme n=1 Tax=Mycolicibacterium sp. 120266 TaxID=3090601 RepID=UPI00299D4646|nr:maleylpyruvate isomerase family mycothiol-dependent enzyme [Mycolicibacterium sp. 120266]MDX1873027.1 maleylpyruvate isomerase family mycothiol-dependent enzyme [Mycolicibacterium sp. 120266]